jgi:hypothetical protein
LQAHSAARVSLSLSSSWVRGCMGGQGGEKGLGLPSLRERLVDQLCLKVR